MAKKGEAFAEFMRNIDEVQKSLEYHHVMRFAYDELNQKGVITCTYTNFTKLCKKHIYKTETKSKVKPVQTVDNDAPVINEPQQTEHKEPEKTQLGRRRNKGSKVHDATISSQDTDSMFGKK